ncbi:unnamed protein product [Discula destructiva]
MKNPPFQALQVQDDNSAAEDLKYILRRCHSMKPQGLSQARSLMTKSIVKDFLSAAKSGLLMVDGHGKSDGAGKTSPLSVWAASFVASLTQTDSVMAVHFFCGLHVRSDPDDPYCGPAGLVKSLVTQLPRFSSDQLPVFGAVDRKVLDDLDTGEPESICELFKTLVSNLNPEKKLFVIIDNMSEFEGSTWTDWHAQTHLLFELLYAMVHKDTESSRRRVRLKVLITNANKATSVRGSVRGSVQDHEMVALRSP